MNQTFPRDAMRDIEKVMNHCSEFLQRGLNTFLFYFGCVSSLNNKSDIILHNAGGLNHMAYLALHSLCFCFFCFCRRMQCFLFLDSSRDFFLCYPVKLPLHA